jgi:hypothetical protein
MRLFISTSFYPKDKRAALDIMPLLIHVKGEYGILSDYAIKDQLRDSGIKGAKADKILQRIREFQKRNPQAMI